MSSLIARRGVEILGMLAVGEGTIGALVPRGHVDLWRGGPRSWDRATRWLGERPTLTRALAVAELAAGMWLMLRATRN
jgi:hypothetical protein